MNSGQYKPSALLDGSLALSEIPISWPKCLQGPFVWACGMNAIMGPQLSGWFCGALPFFSPLSHCGRMKMCCNYTRPKCPLCVSEFLSIHWPAGQRGQNWGIIYIVCTEASSGWWDAQLDSLQHSHCHSDNNDICPPNSLLGGKAPWEVMEKNACYPPSLSYWEQVEKQCSVTAPCCALKNGSNTLLCQRGTQLPALVSPALCESSAIPSAASRPLLRREQLQRPWFVYINKYLCV